jgi:hypothetical protein
MKTTKKVIIFIISLIVISFALKLKNSAILALLHIRFSSNEFLKLIEQLLESFDIITWLIFITISLPFKTKQTSYVLCGIFGLVITLGIILNFIKFNSSIFVSLIFNLFGLFLYFKVVNKFNFIKKVKDNIIVEMDTSKLTWGSAFYTFIYSCVITLVIITSIYSVSLLSKAPIWSILVILPLAEMLVWGLLTGVFNSFGNYLIDRLNVHPAIIRSLYIYTIASIVITIIFYFTSLSGPFSGGTSFWRGMANIGIIFFAMRIFTVSLLQFQLHISRAFQSAYAKKLNEFNFEEVKFKIENDSIIKI